MTKKEKEGLRQEAIAKLKDLLFVGDRVYTVLKHRSSSGMTRHISCYITNEREIRDITWAVADILGYRISDRTGGMVVGGGGMDMGYHVVYSLSRVLFTAGFHCIGNGCPSNDHVNGDKNYKHSNLHKDGGYALRHSWL